MSGLVFGDMGYELHIEGHAEPIDIVGWIAAGPGAVPFYLDDNGHMAHTSFMQYRIVKKQPKVDKRLPAVVDARLPAMLSLWREFDDDEGGMHIGFLLSSLYPRARLNRNGYVWPDELDEFRKAVESIVPCQPGRAPNAQKLKQWLCKVEGCVVDGLYFERLPDYQWRVVPCSQT